MILCILLLIACSGSGSADAATQAAASDPALERALAQIDSAAVAVDRIFQPLPVSTPAEEAALRRFTNAQHLVRARALGIPRAVSDARVAALRAEGRLVALENSAFWIIRDLERSEALAVPVVQTVLTQIGERFQARLAALGAPAFRMEVSSVLRTAEGQAALRRINPNAAAGESTHEYGTTFDVLYSAYAAPLEPFAPLPERLDSAAASVVRRFAELAAERVAGRRALELKAILGKVLIEMQNEGRILVTLERQQPVYHITVARTP